MGRPEGRGPVDPLRRVASGGARFAVTGATGWLGRAAAEVLAAALGDAAGERLALFASRPRTLALDAGPALPVRPLTELPAHPHDVLLHYAYVTRERVAEATGAGAYVAANVAITATVLDAVARQRPQAVVYASSGAVYAAGGALVADLAGDPYGTLKHLDELALRRGAADAGARSLVLRVFNVAGPWVLKPRAFALSDMVLQAAEGAIAIRADRPVLRSYVDVADLGLLAAATAVTPEAGDDLVLDTAGEVVVEMGELAARIASVLGRPDLPVARTWDRDAVPSAYVGDGTALRALAGRLDVPLRDLDEQIARTAGALGVTTG